MTNHRSYKPPIDDPFLGLWNWDDKTDAYVGTFNHRGEKLEIVLSNPLDGNLDDALHRARDVLRRLSDFAEQARHKSVQDLLDLRNGSWKEEDEPILTAAEFLERMSLESVGFDRDGSVDFMFDDGDLFAGHAIEVSMNVFNEFGEAGLFG